MRFLDRRTLLLASAVAFCALPTRAFAQSPTSGVSQSTSSKTIDDQRQENRDGSDNSLKDIVVTADRTGTQVVQVGSFRGATQLDTPLAISVISRDLIDTQQASTLADVLKNTPGVTLSQTSPTVYSNVAIRGILTENRTNYRMDGFLPVINVIDMGLEDKERVEALKGASAIYYGFSPPSGIINMVMKRPTAEPLLFVKVFGSSLGRVGIHGDLGGTRGIFGYRINAVYDRTNSGIDRTAGPRSLISGAFDLKPSDALTVQVDVEHLFKKVNEPGIFRFFPPTIAAPGTRAALLATQNNPNPVIPLPPLLDPSTNFGPDWAISRAEETNLMGQAIWKFLPNFQLVAAAGISRHQRDRHFNTLDWTQTNTNPLRGTVGENIVTQILSQPADKISNDDYKIELTGAFNTGPLRHELLLGTSLLYRLNTNSNTGQLTCLYSTAAATNGQLLGTVFIGDPIPTNSATGSCTQNPFSPHAIPAPAREMALSLRVINRFRELGFYAFDRVKIGDWLQLLGGIRYTDYSQYTDIRIGSGFYATKPITFSGGAVLKLRKNMSLYGTYLEGLEPTPAPGLQAVNVNDTFPPSKSNQYEAGFKWEIRPGLLFQSALFQIERDFYLLNAQNIYGPDGRSRYRGIELGLNGKITKNWFINTSALLLDARQISGAATVVSTVLSPDGSFYITPSTVGNRIEDTAKNTFSFSTSYNLSDLVRGLSVNAGVFHTGNQPINAQNSNFIPAFTTYDLGAALHIDGTPLTVRINAENVTGLRYFISTGSNVVAQAPPGGVKFSVEAAF